MLKQIPKIIVVMGPTASGKSGVAVKLAQKFDGEIISADSRQVYRGLNIGSGKVTRDFKIQDTRYKIQKNSYVSEGIVHHLIDVAEPMEDYNISHFKKDAEKIIKEIVERGKIPIICGGTNFWIDSIIYDSQIPEVSPNEKLRKNLEQKSAAELFEQLKNLDPERAKNIDSKNKVRLIRAIEICQAIGKVPILSSVISHQSSKKYNFLQIGIKTERGELNAKIQKRLNERFEEGMIQEVENLHKNGVSWEWMERIGLEYRWISRFLQDKVELEEMKKRLYFDIIHFAKRQMTWLKRNENITWLKSDDEIISYVKNFLENK